jgi:hypothetical protein
MDNKILSRIIVVMLLQALGLLQAFEAVEVYFWQV